MERKNIAIILASGNGSRFNNVEPNTSCKNANNNLPKQYTLLNHKPIITYCLDVFDKHPLIDEIIVVVHSLYKNLMDDIVHKFNYKKVKHIIIGGSNRSNSSINAIRLCEKFYPQCNVLFHDAVRPMITQQLITDVISALKNYNAVNPVIEAVDTIIEKNLIDNTIANIPIRSTLGYSQTPQGFYLPIIVQAYNKAMLDENFSATDDCGVILKYLPKEKIIMINGDSNNIKITYRNDLFYALGLLMHQKQFIK